LDLYLILKGTIMQQIHKHFPNRRQTPQTEKISGVKHQIQNSAKGISFKLSKWECFKRFLILGTEGGSFYANEKNLSIQNIDNVLECIKENGRDVVDIAVYISNGGQAIKNDAAIYVLALVASCDSKDLRKYALSRLSKICRISTHLFTFIEYVKTMRGFGRTLREAISNWYTNKKIEDLAYQVLKYKQRDGWSHKDVLRLAHPTPPTEDMNTLFSFIVGKSDTIPPVSPYSIGAEKIKTVPKKDVVRLITEYGLTREVIPTEYLNEAEVWEALLQNMPYTALIRNLGKMASIGLHKAFSDSVKLTIQHLTNHDKIKYSRIHPLTIINALMVYQAGHGVRGSLSWDTNPNIIDALEYAFYQSFEYVKPTNKRIMLALDVSASMTMAKIAGTVLNCREASGVLAMTTMKTEQDAIIVGFTDTGVASMHKDGSAISPLPITKNSTLQSTIHSISHLPFRGTDCALPMLYCLQNNIDLDAIVIYTDNETWAGNIHPWQALDQYQNRVGHTVKLVVVGMVSNKFSIARPDYLNMLDVVGFSTNTPAAISEFITLAQ
jgi:60 kDa SS-A/Ro ribonucleoprotein